MKLTDLGNRICILGPSNSGKSTLAHTIGNRCDLPVTHLDLLFHLPHTNWQPRPWDEFVQLHDQAIEQPNWVIEGNYSKTLPQRLARATGVIVLDVSTLTSLLRYFNRTLFQRHRYGALPGNQDSIKWEMVHHIAVVTHKNRKRYVELYPQLTLPKIRLASVKQINKQLKLWDIPPR